jgi:hypothetical protein
MVFGRCRLLCLAPASLLQRAAKRASIGSMRRFVSMCLIWSGRWFVRTATLSSHPGDQAHQCCIFFYHITVSWSLLFALNCFRNVPCLLTKGGAVLKLLCWQADCSLGVVLAAAVS